MAGTVTSVAFATGTGHRSWSSYKFLYSEPCLVDVEGPHDVGVAHADQHAELRLQRGSLRGRHHPLQVQGLDRGLATGRVS